MRYKWSHVLFEYVNQNAIRCYLANIFTLGIYGACYVVARAELIGKTCGVKRPNLKRSIFYTIITLTLYPAVMLSVLAFDLGKVTNTNVGLTVLLLNGAALATAFGSGFLLLAASGLLWAHAFWQIVLAENIANSHKMAKSGC